MALLTIWLRCGMGGMTGLFKFSPQVWLPVKPEKKLSLQPSSVLSPGDECPRTVLVYYFLSTYSLWVISSSFMAVIIFCQPLPHSSPVQPSLSKVPDFAFLTSPNALYPNWTPNLPSRTYSTWSIPISGWWLLRFPVAQVTYFSIILVPVSLPHNF